MKKKMIWKGCAIGFGVLLLLGLSLYLGMAAYYSGRFGYDTWINGVYCTGRSVSEVNEELLDQLNYEGLTVRKEDGSTYTITADAVLLSLDYSQNLQLFVERQNPCLWITNYAGGSQPHSLTPAISYDALLFKRELIRAGLSKAAPEEERVVEIRKGEQGYYLINERVHVLDEELAAQKIKDAFENLETELDLEKAGCYRDLPLDEEMKAVLQLYEKLASYQDCGIVYQMGEEQIPVDAAIACEFLLVDEEGAFVMDKDGNLCADEEKVAAFVDTLADTFDTVGKSRQFRATRGEVVTVKGGIYGNLIDREAEKEYLLTAFLQHKKEIHIPAYTQMAMQQGRDDIGDTYIEVDMTEQMLYYYVNGRLEIETPVVTGNTSLRRGTPSGTNYVYAKQQNRILRGADYQSFVNYWIPVKGAIGIHDASWRSEYGGEIYKTGGSHGCINTPYEEVSRLYEMVEIGTPCVMFY